jgi:hypothetical protein
MNWTWNVRSNDGAMNGLEFARCTTAGGFGRVLIHAAPAGGEVGILRSWRHADDRSWWQWSIEFSNHTGRPDDWSPPDS